MLRCGNVTFSVTFAGFYFEILLRAINYLQLIFDFTKITSKM